MVSCPLWFKLSSLSSRSYAYIRLTLTNTTGSGIDKNGVENTLYGMLLGEYPLAAARVRPSGIQVLGRLTVPNFATRPGPSLFGNDFGAEVRERAPGRIGLIPMSETGLANEADVRKAFPVGADVEVVILEIDPTGRRIRLSAKAVLDAREAEEVREFRERSGDARAEKFGGSLADKLRGALKPRQD